MGRYIFVVRASFASTGMGFVHCCFDMGWVWSYGCGRVRSAVWSSGVVALQICVCKGTGEQRVITKSIRALNGAIGGSGGSWEIRFGVGWAGNGVYWTC